MSLERPYNTPLNPNFIDLVNQAYKNGNWTLFVKKYGTHYIDSSVEGGRISSKQQMSYESYAILKDS